MFALKIKYPPARETSVARNSAFEIKFGFLDLSI
jgi:hypothetical protein